jgi:hypothetical protein
MDLVPKREPLFAVWAQLGRVTYIFVARTLSE